MATLKPWLYMPTQDSWVQERLRARRAAHPLLFRIVTPESHTHDDSNGNHVAGSFDDGTAARQEIEDHIDDGTEPFDPNQVHRHMDKNNTTPSPFISCTASPRWAFWEGYRRMFLPPDNSSRPPSADTDGSDSSDSESEPQVYLLVIDWSRLDNDFVTEAYDSISEKLEFERFCAQAAQEFLVFGMIPSDAILARIDLTGEPIQHALEWLYPSLASDGQDTDRSFSEAWTVQALRWKRASVITNHNRGIRGAILALAMLDELWNNDWKTAVAHTKALAEQILLELFIFYQRGVWTHAAVYDGIDYVINEKKAEILSNESAATDIREAPLHDSTPGGTEDIADLVASMTLGTTPRPTLVSTFAVN